MGFSANHEWLAFTGDKYTTAQHLPSGRTIRIPESWDVEQFTFVQDQGLFMFGEDTFYAVELATGKVERTPAKVGEAVLSTDTSSRGTLAIGSYSGIRVSTADGLSLQPLLAPLLAALRDRPATPPVPADAAPLTELITPLITALASVVQGQQTTNAAVQDLAEVIRRRQTR